MDRKSDPLFSGRRLLLKSALLVSAAGLAVGGGVFFRRGLNASGLTEDGRSVFRAMARAVAGETLPTDPSKRKRILDEFLFDFETALMNLPAAKRMQISAVAGVLANAPTRYMTTGRWRSWAQASDDEVCEALRHMRESGNMLTDASFNAVRAVISINFYSAKPHWALAHYPGPMPI
jgi:hypothetical protein